MADRPKIGSKALIVVTSHRELGTTGRKTGFYFDEMAAPYWALRDAGYEVVVASVAGGSPAWDAGSYGEESKRAPAVQRFIDDGDAMASLSRTPAVSTLDPTRYQAVFLPGGHGTMWDFTDAGLCDLIGRAWDNGAVIGAVCHGPAALVNARDAAGQPIVAGRKVNSFTDAEELAVGLTDIVPFLLETELRKQGASFESSPNFQEHAVRDGRLVTGQNPQSVAKVARLLLEALADTQQTGASVA